MDKDSWSFEDYRSFIIEILEKIWIEGLIEERTEKFIKF
jgi:hypothetical protein